MLKVFGKNRQATRLSDKNAARRLTAKRMLKFTHLILIASLVTWGWQFLQNPRTLPIEAVKIHSSDSFIKRTQILKAIQPYIKAGFFNVNLKRINESLLALPWVANVTIDRIWPHTLTIQLHEQEPIARWDANALVNQQGQLFYPPVSTFPEGLPELSGPLDQEKQILIDFQRLSHILSAINLSVDSIKMNPEEAITLSLSNGIELALGRAHLGMRLDRFVDVYPKVLSGKAIAYVDMRYTDGMSVRMKEDKVIKNG